MTPLQLYNQLTANPAYILQYYQLTIAGGSIDGWTQFSFTPRVGTFNPRPGRILGILNMHAAQAFQIVHAPMVGPANVFPAFNVRMQIPGTYVVGAIAGYLLPEPGPPALMLTG